MKIITSGWHFSKLSESKVDENLFDIYEKVSQPKGVGGGAFSTAVQI